MTEVCNNKNIITHKNFLRQYVVDSQQGDNEPSSDKWRDTGRILRLSLHVDLVMSEIQSEDMLISSYLERRGTRYMASEHSDLGGVTRDNPASQDFTKYVQK